MMLLQVRDAKNGQLKERLETEPSSQPLEATKPADTLPLDF